MIEKHVNIPTFSNAKTESRLKKEKNGSSMGPGHYEPSFASTEKKVLVYSGSKEANSSFLDKLLKRKDKTPDASICYVDQPLSKVEDRQGRAKHAKLIVLDRSLAPRSIDSA